MKFEIKTINFNWFLFSKLFNMLYVGIIINRINLIT